MKTNFAQLNEIIIENYDAYERINNSDGIKFLKKIIKTFHANQISLDEAKKLNTDEIKEVASILSSVAQTYLFLADFESDFARQFDLITSAKAHYQKADDIIKLIPLNAFDDLIDDSKFILYCLDKINYNNAIVYLDMAKNSLDNNKNNKEEILHWLNKSRQLFTKFSQTLKTKYKNPKIKKDLGISNSFIIDIENYISTAKKLTEDLVDEALAIQKKRKLAPFSNELSLTKKKKAAKTTYSCSSIISNNEIEKLSTSALSTSVTEPSIEIPSVTQEKIDPTPINTTSSSVSHNEIELFSNVVNEISLDLTSIRQEKIDPLPANTALSITSDNEKNDLPGNNGNSRSILQINSFFMPAINYVKEKSCIPAIQETLEEYARLKKEKLMPNFNPYYQLEKAAFLLLLAEINLKEKMPLQYETFVSPCVALSAYFFSRAASMQVWDKDIQPQLKYYHDSYNELFEKLISPNQFKEMKKEKNIFVYFRKHGFGFDFREYNGKTERQSLELGFEFLSKHMSKQQFNHLQNKFVHDANSALNNYKENKPTINRSYSKGL